MSKELLQGILPQKEFCYPSVIDSMLLSFKVFEQFGGIIGGAVRDFVLEKPMRDYDIYIQSTWEEVSSDEREIAIHARRFGYIMGDLSRNADYESNSILAVYRLMKDDIIVEVIIGKQTLEEHVKNFTCDISKIWYDVFTGEVNKTEEFQKVVDTNISKVNNVRGSANFVIDEYVARMKNKYPEVTFVRA